MCDRDIKLLLNYQNHLRHDVNKNGYKYSN